MKRDWVNAIFNLRRLSPVLLDLALIQIGIFLSYLARFGDELFLHRNAWEPYWEPYFNPDDTFVAYVPAIPGCHAF